MDLLILILVIAADACALADVILTRGHGLVGVGLVFLSTAALLYLTR